VQHFKIIYKIFTTRSHDNNIITDAIREVNSPRQIINNLSITQLSPVYVNIKI